MKLIYKKNVMTVALIWAGCFVLFFTIFMLVIVPQGKRKEIIEKELADKKQQYQSALEASKEGTKIQLKKRIEQLRNELEDFVVDFEDSANLTFDIGRIAREQGIDSFSVKAKGRSGVTGIPNCNSIGENYLNISFTGQFNQFVVFLNTLERHRPVIFVDGFTITSSRVRERSMHRANLNVAVFVKK